MVKKKAVQLARNLEMRMIGKGSNNSAQIDALDREMKEVGGQTTTQVIFLYCFVSEVSPPFPLFS